MNDQHGYMLVEWLAMYIVGQKLLWSSLQCDLMRSFHYWSINYEEKAQEDECHVTKLGLSLKPALYLEGEDNIFHEKLDNFYQDYNHFIDWAHQLICKHAFIV